MPFIKPTASPSNFTLVASCCGTGGPEAPFSEANVVAASQKFGLFTPDNECYGDATAKHFISEWGYEFQVCAWPVCRSRSKTRGLCPLVCLAAGETTKDH